MSPSKVSESVDRVVALLVEELAVELDVDVESAGSTTFKREDITRGFEPDSASTSRISSMCGARRTLTSMRGIHHPTWSSVEHRATS